MTASSHAAVARDDRDGLGRTLCRRVVSFFLLPPADTAADVADPPAWAPPVAPDAARTDVAHGAPTRRLRTAAVLGAMDDVPAVAAALANTLAARRPPVVGCWSPAPDAPDPADALPTAHAEEGVASPALPGARRAAASLAAAGIPAAARGRVAWVCLPSDPADAATTWAATRDHADADGAAILAVAGPRPEALDPYLAGQDLIVLVVRDAGLALETLARAALGAGPEAVVVTVPPLTGAARLLALAGLGRLGLPLDGDPAPATASTCSGVPG